MAKKILFLGLALMMCLVLFAGCGKESEYYTDRVLVLVGAECREEFLAGDFSFERFEWKNVRKIEDSNISDSPEYLWLKVYLKRKGEKHVQVAIEHFNTLDFVLGATVEMREKPSIVLNQTK